MDLNDRKYIKIKMALEEMAKEIDSTGRVNKGDLFIAISECFPGSNKNVGEISRGIDSQILEIGAWESGNWGAIEYHLRKYLESALTK